MKQLPRDQRRQSILDAARDILIESGAETLSMPEIAARVGVSRQILYLHFHGIDEVLDALYDQAFQEYFKDLMSQPATFSGQAQMGLARLERLLVLPPTIYRVFSGAFFAGPASRPAQRMLQRKIIAMMESNWMEPLMRTGLDAGEARAGLHAIVGATLIFRDMIDRGDLDRASANRQLRRIADAVFPVGLAAAPPRPSEPTDSAR